MSLLDKGREDVVVFPQEVTTDSDGNTTTRPSLTGIATKARIEVLGQSGTSSRRQEQDNEGFESERVYRIRFTRKFDQEFGVLRMQSQIEWKTDAQGRPMRWALFGEPAHYNGSPRTARNEYTMKRF